MNTSAAAVGRVFKNGSSFPLLLLGYGALYAFGYTVWETPALATKAVAGPEYDVSWLVSAAVVPLVLIAIALWARSGVQGAPGRAWRIAAPVLGVVGSVLSVVYQYVGSSAAALGLAVASGVCTAVASALFVVLWSLVFARFNMATVETAVPLAFVIPLLCSLVVPAMSQMSALVVALLLVLLCAGALLSTERALDEGHIVPERLEERVAPALARDESTPAIVRVLLYGVVAWSLCSFAPCLGEPQRPWATPGGIDVVSAAGYLLAIVYARCIIGYAVRVDFLALATMTLPPFVLSVALYAFAGEVPQTIASVLNVAVSACFEIILLVYFVRLAQAKGRRRLFWLAIGSLAGYGGVFVGQVSSVLWARAQLPLDQRPLWCLAVICVYVLALMLVPQRRPYALADASPRVAGASPKAAEVAGEGATLPREDSQIASAPIAVDPIDAVCASLVASRGLSAREAEICGYLARGRSQTYIRDALFLSKNTVSTHVRHLYTKLGVHSKQELIDLVESLR